MPLTVVYDWNGTLLDDADAFTTSINTILTHFRRPEIDAETLREICEFPFSRLYEKLATGRGSGQRQRAVLRQLPAASGHVWIAYWRRACTRGL